MDHFKILKRAFDITRDYRALWVFGILLALTSGGGGGGGNGGGGSGGDGGGNGGGFPGGFPGFNFTQETGQIIIGIVIGIIILVLVLVVVGVIIRYLATTALVKMTDRYEERGEKVSVREGFRLGWSRTNWKLFGIDLYIFFPTFFGVLLLLALAASPLLLLLTENRAAGAIGVVMTIGLVFLAILLIIVAAVIINLLREFAYRAAILDSQGVRDSFKLGWKRLRSRLGDVALMWLFLFGIGLVWAVLMIPLTIILLLLGAFLGGLPGLLVGTIAAQFSQGALPWILGGLIGVPIFLLTLAVPLTFLGGLYETFNANVWTLTYREIRALETQAPPPAPAPELAPAL